MATQRRQILQLMGIDVWVERRVAAAAAEDALPAGDQPATVDTGRARVSPPTQALPVVDDFPACRILALRQGSVLLLTDMGREALARRLGRDLLASMITSEPANLVETLFDWQPENLSSVALDGRRALGAFIDRQLDDLDSASAVLASVEVQQLLPELAEQLAQRSLGHLAIASLTELAVSADAKRKLWTQLQQLRQ